MAEASLKAESATIKPAPAPDDLLTLRMNGMTPFVSHEVGVHDRIREARGLLLVLESAYRTAAEAQHFNGIDTITNLNPTIIADALDGVATLLALGQFHVDDREG